MSHLSPNPIATLSKAAFAGFGILCLVAAPAFAARAGPWPQFQGGPSHPGSTDGPAPPYRQAWAFPVAQVGDQAVSPPIIVGDQVITVGPTVVYGIDLATGRERWSIPRAAGPTSPPAVASVRGAPVLLYTEGSTASDAMLQAVELATRKPAWDSPLALGEESRSGVTVDGDTAFVGDESGRVHAVDVATGSERWSTLLSAGVPGPLTGSTPSPNPRWS